MVGTVWMKKNKNITSPNLLKMIQHSTRVRVHNLQVMFWIMVLVKRPSLECLCYFFLLLTLNSYELVQQEVWKCVCGYFLSTQQNIFFIHSSVLESSAYGFSMLSLKHHFYDCWNPLEVIHWLVHKHLISHISEMVTLMVMIITVWWLGW